MAVAAHSAMAASALRYYAGLGLIRAGRSAEHLERALAGDGDAHAA